MNAPASPVTCVTCRVPFSAADVMWCKCLSREHSVVCPHCCNCLCRVTPARRSEFWANAPQVLWEEKLRRLRDERQKGGAAEEAAAADARPVLLLVDDSRTVRMAVRQSLKDFDCRFIEAGNGQEALELARVHKPVVVISDAFMPKMDGREMCEAMKRDPELSATRVIIMSGLYTAARYSTEARKSFGVDEYLAKPVDVAKLRAAVVRFLIEAAPADVRATA
ncbi:MAG TPA: response regulator [Thermoanaerobaculia bacterium]